MKEGTRPWVRGGNPYMPLWEHVPDGEPRVFTCQGKSRVYVYGSHDTLRREYCGRDYVVWSAPVEDLTDWTCHGICYQAADGSVLYAPDVVQKGDTWYMYAAERKGSRIMVATAKTPWGPFENPVQTELGFDPGILVDDDGRVYAYWGFCESFCAELNEDMATIKEGTLHRHPLPHCRADSWTRDKDHIDPEIAFFEASSPRKIFGKYVYIYSKRVGIPRPELGIYSDNNGFLSYRWSDSPLEGFRGGGDISFNGGEILRDGEGRGEMTFRWGNNHGSVAEINGRWYVFYHRQTGRDEFSRQAMLEPIEAAVGKDGSIYLGKVHWEDGEPVSSEPVEMTSQGPQVNGLNAREWISAGYACHLRGGLGKAYIERVDEMRPDVSAPVADLTSGTVVGFRYLQFGQQPPERAVVKCKMRKNVFLTLRVDAWDGQEVACVELPAGETLTCMPLKASLTGKHALYFVFTAVEECDSDQILGSFDSFTFADEKDWT